MRLFVGIEFPETIIVALVAVQDGLRGRSEQGRFKRRENFHLTLKFLGEVPAADLDRLAAPLAAVAAAARQFSLRLGRLGQFGIGNPARTVWVDVAGDLDPLAKLQDAVEHALAPLGYPAERRPWRPHITLAQDVTMAAGAPPWDTYTLDRTPFTVSEFSLILSEEADRRRVYTPVRRFPLPG